MAITPQPEAFAQRGCPARRCAASMTTIIMKDAGTLWLNIGDFGRHTGF